MVSKAYLGGRASKNPCRGLPPALPRMLLAASRSLLFLTVRALSLPLFLSDSLQVQLRAFGPGLVVDRCVVVAVMSPSAIYSWTLVT